MSAIFQEPDIPRGHPGQVWPHRPSHWRPSHYHGELELNLVTSGRARVRLGGAIHQVTAGDLIWLVPGEQHELVSAEPGFFMWVVAFSQELRASVERRLASNAWPPLGARIVHLAEYDRTALSERFESSRKSGPNECLFGSVLEGAAKMTSTRSPNEAPRLHAAVRQAAALLCQDPGLSRSHLAQALSLNREHLSRLFVDELGVGLAAYRNRVRLARSVALLEAGHRSVTEAGFDAGFGSYPQFHRSFVREFGVSPAHFRSAGTRESRMQRVSDLPDQRVRNAP